MITITFTACLFSTLLLGPWPTLAIFALCSVTGYVARKWGVVA